MNLASAIFGALAVGVATWLAAELAASTLAGIVAALFLAFSYTFWSQAITAEVYTLHLLIVGAALIALLAWEKRQTLPRLALFYAIYALGFGNHLSLILLLPGFALFLLAQRRPGKGDPLATRAILMAIAIAIGGALQYAWNFRGLWWDLEPPANLGDALARFWFDVTKADWRETLIMGVSETGLQNRPAMYWWDLRQQFGVPGIVLAVIGLGYLLSRWPRRAALLLVLYVTALAFAWTYNVGDAYIFFLPSHYLIALWAGAGVAALMWLTRSVSPLPSALIPLPFSLAPVIGVLCLLYPAWRAYDDFPALDRRDDTRAVQLLDQLTAPACDGGETVVGVDANWQVQNGVEYYMRERKPGAIWFVLDDLKWLPSKPEKFSALVADNVERHRIVAVSSNANAKLAALNARGPIVEVEPEHRATPFAEKLAALAKGTPYALAVLRPDSEFPIDAIELQRIWQRLEPSGAPVPPINGYTIVVGRVGQRPNLFRTALRPYRATTAVGPLTFDVRMESWLPTDTIRRSGFGHVIVNRRHALTLERGISFLALQDSGALLLSEYHSSLFAAPQRFILGSRGTSPAPCYR